MDAKYLAPSRMCGEYLDLPEIWCNWGLLDHEKLQCDLGRLRTGVNEELAREIVRDSPFSSLRGEDLFHAAFGMISQFVREDIEYFLAYDTPNRPIRLERAYDILCANLPKGYLQWIPSETTTILIARKLGIDPFED